VFSTFLFIFADINYTDGLGITKKEIVNYETLMIISKSPK